jgi:hypothetical protein
VTSRRPKVWYILCSTGGKVESAYLVRTRGASAVLSNTATGPETGHNPLCHVFLTRAQAVTDWRRRSKAEVAHGADVLHVCAERLAAQAAVLRNRAARTLGDWRDL